MSDYLHWIINGAAAAVLAIAAWAGKVIVWLPRDYVPRDQINTRFESLKREIQNDMQAQDRRNAVQDARNQQQFNIFDSKLDRILDKLDNKADKH